MSNKISLESRQRLPGKVQDVICDVALIVQNGISIAGSNEMLTSSSKLFAGFEQNMDNTIASLNKLDAIIDSMNEQCTAIENNIESVSDVQETIQLIERNKYFTQEGKGSKGGESDMDSNS